jgi:hypothetical protein
MGNQSSSDKGEKFWSEKETYYDKILDDVENDRKTARFDSGTYEESKFDQKHSDSVISNMSNNQKKKNRKHSEEQKGGCFK